MQRAKLYVCEERIVACYVTLIIPSQRMRTYVYYCLAATPYISKRRSGTVVDQ